MFIYVDLVGSQTLHQGALFTLITSAAITGNTAPTWFIGALDNKELRTGKVAEEAGCFIIN